MAAFFLNIRSLRCHQVLLVCLIENLCVKPIVIALYETWLTDNDPLDIYKLPGCSSIIVKNRQQKKGGGVAFFVRKDLNFEEVEYKCNIESATIELTDKKFNLIKCVGYRPPSLSFDNFQDDFEFLLVQHTKRFKKLLTWGTLT